MNASPGLFEHHHPHSYEQSPSVELDPAHQSLSDALRVSFWVLKIVMVLLLGVYSFSGVFNVREQEVAVRLRFGKIVGDSGQQVLTPGGPYFAFPFPIEQIVRVSTSPEQVELDREFWYEIDSSGVGLSAMQGKPGPLDPRRDGSLLTGDANIVHARWTATYTVVDPVNFVTKVGDASTARMVVSAAAQQGVVYASSRVGADELMKAQQLDSARRRTQSCLDTLGCGIQVTSLALKEAAFPLSVRPAVQLVLDAESEKTQSIEAAQQQWNTILGNTAGEAYPALLALVDRYEQANDTEDQAQAWRLQDEMDAVFDRLMIGYRDRVVAIGGEVAAMLHEAKTYRTEIVAQMRGESQYFASLLPQYRQNPEILLNRLWQDARQQILTGDIETIYLPPGQAYLELNRDPLVAKQRERKRLMDEQRQRENVNR